MELLKGLLKNKAVLGLLLAAVVAGLAMATGVPKEAIKAAYCDAQPLPVNLPAPLKEEK